MRATMTYKIPDGYILKSEAQALIAESNPYAPKKYEFKGVDKGKVRPNLRVIVMGSCLYVNKADLLREMKAAPFISTKAHMRMGEYISAKEVKAIIAKSGPHAPKNYSIQNLLRGIKTGRRNIRYMYKCGHVLVSKSDLMREIRKCPFVTDTHRKGKAPHIDEYLTTYEASKLVAKSNPHAPQNYDVARGMLKRKTHGHIRTFKEAGYLYIHEADFRESLKRYPIYDGAHQSATLNSFLNFAHHIYVNSLPEGEDDWMPVSEVARITGAKKTRVWYLVKSLYVKGVIYKKRIHVRLSKAMEYLVLRESNFIKRQGLNPDDYPVVDLHFVPHVGCVVRIHYAPDLIAK